jgi:hypothetical protein
MTGGGGGGASTITSGAGGGGGGGASTTGGGGAGGGGAGGAGGGGAATTTVAAGGGGAGGGGFEAHAARGMTDASMSEDKSLFVRIMMGRDYGTNGGQCASTDRRPGALAGRKDRARLALLPAEH